MGMGMAPQYQIAARMTPFIHSPEKFWDDQSFQAISRLGMTVDTGVIHRIKKSN